MSKRHKKSTLTFSSQSEGPLDPQDYAATDYYEAPKGKKPKGKHRRGQSNHKTAYWDD